MGSGQLWNACMCMCTPPQHSAECLRLRVRSHRADVEPHSSGAAAPRSHPCCWRGRPARFAPRAAARALPRPAVPPRLAAARRARRWRAQPHARRQRPSRPGTRREAHPRTRRSGPARRSARRRQAAGGPPARPHRTVSEPLRGTAAAPPRAPTRAPPARAATAPPPRLPRRRRRRRR